MGTRFYQFAMRLTRERFVSFAPHPPADARAATEVLLALQLESRAAVEAMVKEAVAAGGNIYITPQDHGFMFQHGFQDRDGHVWEVFQMNAV